MSDFELNKINKKILDIIQEYSSLSEVLANFIENPTQENLDYITEKISNIDVKEKNMKDILMHLVKTVMNPDTEIIGEVSNKGIEL